MNKTQEFHLVFTIRLSDTTDPEKFGFTSECAATMKGEFTGVEIKGIEYACIIEFVEQLQKKMQRAIATGYNVN